jgi:hypothetical protein
MRGAMLPAPTLAAPGRPLEVLVGQVEGLGEDGGPGEEARPRAVAAARQQRQQHDVGVGQGVAQQAQRVQHPAIGVEKGWWRQHRLDGNVLLRAACCRLGSASASAATWPEGPAHRPRRRCWLAAHT